MPQGFQANGDIFPCRFVKLDTTVDGKVLQCGAGDQVYGISQKATRRSPYIDTSNKAAVAGEPILVYNADDIEAEVPLQCGGTVTRGQRLKADTNGKGIATTADGDEYGAIAQQSGTTDQLILVQIVRGQRGA